MRTSERKTLRWLCLLLCLGLLFGASCGPQTPAEPSEGGTDVTERELAAGCPYFFEYGCTVTGDDHLTALTGEGSAVTVKPLRGNTELTLETIDWSEATRTMKIANDRAALSVDLGPLCAVTGFALEGYGGECEVYYSTDGYNFSFYAGEFGASATGLHLTAKALQFLLPYGEKGEISLSAVRVYGTRASDRVLLSKGATYSSPCKSLSAYPDDGTRLTDGRGVEDAGEDTVAGFQGMETDPVTRKTGVVFTLDLGSVRHISDVLLGYYSAPDRKVEPPEQITVRVSDDGENWTDFGQSYLRTWSGAPGTASRLYFVTHPETVEGRYLRFFTYTTTFLTDEVSVYGYENEVKADFSLIQRTAQPSDANAAAYMPAKLNGKDAPEMTDRLYGEYAEAEEKENTAEISLGQSYEGVAGLSLTYAGLIQNWKYTDGNGKELTVAQEYSVRPSTKYTKYVWFDEAVTADTVKISFSGKGAKLYECEVYVSAPHLPLVRGGFFQISVGGGSSNSASKNTPYSWYLQLKGMKDLGMDYVVLQYGASYTDKETIVDGDRIKAAGYTYTPTYGSGDVPGAILDAADKLDMKVWLGTIHGADFTKPGANKAEYEQIVRDGIALIEDIHARYAAHPSFAGYYLSDEQCDQWLNIAGGVSAARTVYKGQSDHIRELDPDATVMIAPAIWRSGAATDGADNLYRAIVAENEGERPVVDIVAAQDCLGRLSTLTVDHATYDAFESYCAEWAKAVRRAGVQFWHDAEVFEQTYTAKRISETVLSLGLEAKMSGSIIVFDIPHYMTLFPSASYDDLRSLYRMRQTREYAKYYAEFSGLDAKYADAKEISPKTDDGHEVPDGKKSAIAGVKHSTEHNAGVVTSGNVPENWQTFKVGNGKGVPEFALSFDGDAFYVGVKMHDDTDSTKSGTWWSGKDDLIQIWMMPEGRQSNGVLSEQYGIRFYLHKTKTGWVSGGETGSTKTDLSGFTFTADAEQAVITMPWESLGILPPQAGDGTAMGIVIQYIDGEDESWAASNGSKGQGVAEDALYSF